MMTTAYDRVTERLRDDGRRVIESRPGAVAMAQCPAHADRTPSLSVRRIEAMVLLHCHAGCMKEDVLTALGLTMTDLYDDPRGSRHRYRDADNRVVRTVRRTPSKTFSQSGDTKGTPTLYRLPQLLASVEAGATVYLVEGEKDVHAVESLGGVATTAPMGGNNFGKADNTPLHDRHVVAVVDRDEVGQRWAVAVAAALRGRAKSLRFVQAKEGKDAADHIAAGHTLEDLEPVDPPVVVAPVVHGAHDEDRLEDAHLAGAVAERALRGRYCYAHGMGWRRYVMGCWRASSPEHVEEQVRLHLIDRLNEEALAGADPDRLRKLSGLLSASRIRSVTGLTRGILEVEAADFDQQADLLNVGNGVVDLATGELLDHSPRYLFTKTTPVKYVPGAVSKDWDLALTSVPVEAVAYLQERIGQAASGHPTPDDTLLVITGGGSNAKTTVLGAVVRVLGDHAVGVPERVLMTKPSDHPTELMTLRGARLALIEETPEARHLSVKRLKDTVGTPTMTARLIGKDNVTWRATHSLFLTSNYIPRVEETDHGTWRRLQLLRFPYTYVGARAGELGPNQRRAVPGLRERLMESPGGQHEAALAWIVEGARRWYARDRVLAPAPQVVDDDTGQWRADADLIYGFVSEHLVFDPACHVTSTELFSVFDGWLTGRGHTSWSETTFVARFGQHQLIDTHGVVKKRRRPIDGMSTRGLSQWPRPGQAIYTAWLGVRFRDEQDGDATGEGADLLDHGGLDGQIRPRLDRYGVA